MRVKMVVAYDGTNYSGWQIQPNGVTIEQKLNEALQALLGEDIRVVGASRTDAGVHSLGNVCIFDTDTRMPAEKISYALNQRLPEDIVVQDSCEVPDTFHPRFSRSRKTYEYRILNRRSACRPGGWIHIFIIIRWMWRKCRRPRIIWLASMILKVSVRSMHSRKPAYGRSMHVRSRKKRILSRSG